MITLTKSAQNFLEGNLSNSPTGTKGIRLGLRDAGCSGFAYTFDFTNVENNDDQIFTFDDIKIYISEKFMAALHGTEIDYVTQGVNSVLQFNNPNVKNACGCGESVQFKENEQE